MSFDEPQNYSLKAPISIEYTVFMILGIFVSFVASFGAISIYPNYSELFLILVVPIITLAYSLFASLLMREREILFAPAQMVFSCITAVSALIVQYIQVYKFTEYNNLIFGVLFVYTMWIAGSMIFQNAIRRVVGSYGNRETFDKYIQSFQSTKSINEIRYELKNRWLSLFCGLRIAEDKSNNNEIKIRLKKLGTNLYIGLYGFSKDSLTVIQAIPYCIRENIHRRDMVLDDNVKTFDDILKENEQTIDSIKKL